MSFNMYRVGMGKLADDTDMGMYRSHHNQTCSVLVFFLVC